MSQLKLIDLIDRDMLEEIQEGFAEVTGMAALVLDENGQLITKGSNMTDFCMKYTRRSSIGCQRCERSNNEGSKRTQRSGRSAAYFCHCGLMDFSAPIIVNGEFLGSFVGGQVLTEEPDEEKYRRLAREFSINEDEYIAALRKVKVVPAIDVEKAAKFLHTIAKSISELAYANYTAKLRTGTAPGGFEVKAAARPGSVMSANLRAANEVLDKFTELAAIAEKCSAEVKSTNETVKVIKDIAMNTRILGFNASIEASKAKESGKGFGVIAQEVRSLADTSKSSADKIEAKMKSIAEYARQMEENAVAAQKLAREGINEMELLSAKLDSMNLK